VEPEEPVPEPPLLPLLLLLVEPSVPLETALPGRLTGAFAARAWKLASERVALAAVLFFVNMDFGGRVEGRTSR
jgi:hypothetical protein